MVKRIRLATPPQTALSAPDPRRQAIAVVAYCRAEASGFPPGGEEMDDWLQAGREQAAHDYSGA